MICVKVNAARLLIVSTDFEREVKNTRKLTRVCVFCGFWSVLLIRDQKRSEMSQFIATSEC